jgi:hypothetical protein
MKIGILGRPYGAQRKLDEVGHDPVSVTKIEAYTILRDVCIESNRRKIVERNGATF